MWLKGNLKRINHISKVSYCMKPKASKKYMRTILTTKTTFPLKVYSRKLVERDAYINKIAGFENIYEWQKAHLSEPEFVLHDGSAYANEQVHMENAINIILKDTILRNEILKGNSVPSWNCHELSNELETLNDLNSIEIRKRARNFGKEIVENQQRIYRSWGVMGNWKNAYTSSSPSYMKLQFKQFFKLYEKNLICRECKPVYSSPSSKTALPEVELEINDKHHSPSIYVKLKINHNVSSSKNKNVYAIIWTTSPWTLPSIQAVCLSYSLVHKSESPDQTYVIATDLVQNFSNALKANFEVLETIPGNVLEDVVYEHPLYTKKVQKFISLSLVDSSKGTGLKHLAGAHALDDFLICLEHKMQVVDLIDDTSCFKSEAGPFLQGKYALTDGNNTIIELLKNNLLHQEEIIHSYPYDWHTGKPVIIKLSKQWFVDTNTIKTKAMEVLESVKFLSVYKSDIYRLNLIQQIQKIPYWCISKQRNWGIPIPVLYNQNEAPYKTIYVHGFAVDENGIKISNVVDPVDITNGKNSYGIDILRWWVNHHATRQMKAKVSTNVLESCVEEVLKIRSILRFALGHLNDFENTTVDTSKLLLIDRYMLHLLYQFHNRISESMKNFLFHEVCTEVLNFLTNSVSKLYYIAIKDRLFCEMINSAHRKSAQMTLYQILEILTQSIAPMLPHLAEELYLHFPQKKNNTQKERQPFFMSVHPKPSIEWKDEGIEKLFGIILACKSEINEKIGITTNDAVVKITFSRNIYENFFKPITDFYELENQLIDIFQVSKVQITQGDITELYNIELSKSKKHSCPRCRKINADYEDDLCKRCYQIYNYLRSKTAFVMN